MLVYLTAIIDGHYDSHPTNYRAISLRFSKLKSADSEAFEKKDIELEAKSIFAS